MNVLNQYDEKENGFTEVVAFCHVTCRYFNRFRVDRNWCQACFLKQARAGFIKIDPVRIVGMRVRVCVCLRPRLLITSGVIWRDMNLIRLVKQN